jgi:hypothetical protein
MIGFGSRRVRVGCLTGLSALTLIAAGAVAPRWSDFSVTSADGTRLTVGKIGSAPAWIGAALAQGCADRCARDRHARAWGHTYRLPRMEFTGANLSRADLLGLFDRAAPEPLSTRLARLSAQRIALPRVSWSSSRSGRCARPRESATSPSPIWTRAVSPPSWPRPARSRAAAARRAQCPERSGASPSATSISRRPRGFMPSAARGLRANSSASTARSRWKTSSCGPTRGPRSRRAGSAAETFRPARPEARSWRP